MTEKDAPMRPVTYSMSASLDGYIVGPDGRFDWSAPDPTVFRFWIDEIRGVGVHLMGRRLYETMLYWETAEEDQSLDQARSLRAGADGEVLVTDGPYLETKEYVGGLWVLDVADLDEALAWGRKAAIACRVPVEVRPFH